MAILAAGRVLLTVESPGAVRGPGAEKDLAAGKDPVAGQVRQARGVAPPADLGASGALRLLQESLNLVGERIPTRLRSGNGGTGRPLLRLPYLGRKPYEKVDDDNHGDDRRKDSPFHCRNWNERDHGTATSLTGETFAERKATNRGTNAIMER